MICVNEIENRIMFKIKTGFCLELLTPEIIKLLGSTKSKITKNKNGENVPHLEILLAMIIKKIREFNIHLFQIKHLVNC